MTDWPNLLRIAILLPSAGALAIALFRPRRTEAEPAFARWTAMVVALATLALTVWLVWGFPLGGREFAVSDTGLWFGDTSGHVDIRLSLGLDGLSLWLFALTSLLMVLAIAVSEGDVFSDDLSALFFSTMFTGDVVCQQTQDVLDTFNVRPVSWSDYRMIDIKGIVSPDAVRRYRSLIKKKYKIDRIPD